MRIEGRNITYQYPGEPEPVFSGLSFSLEGPGFISLFGLSGTGKSTLARIISAEIRPDAGTLSISPDCRILYSHNTERLPGWYSVGEHIEQVTAPHSRDLADLLIRELSIEPIMPSRFRELSMGQKNRINLLRYLLQDFDILIGDEILANVDEPTRNHILGAIKQHFSHRTFLYISHNAAEVVRFSRHILVLPVTTATGQRSLLTLPGMDMSGNTEPRPEKIQENVLLLLQAAATGSASDIPPHIAGNIPANIPDSNHTGNGNGQEEN